MKFQAVPANYSDEIPTFSKWSKTVEDFNAVIPHVVEVIWLPNLYSNFTLQTSSYRFRVPKGHPYFEVISNFIQEWKEEGAVLVLTSSNFPKPQIELQVLEDSISIWEELGDAGFKVTNIKAPSKADRQKTRKADSAKSSAAL